MFTSVGQSNPITDNALMTVTHQLPRHVGAIWVDVFIPTYSV